MTECIQDRFGFASVSGSREIVAEFSGGTISSDGGGLLLQETDSKMNLLARFSQCFIDGRNPDLIEPGMEPLAGKSTLNRMELGTGTPTRYKKITYWRDSVDELLVDVFLEAHSV